MNREYVIFKLEDEYYGISIHHVENIERNINITRVPNTKRYIKGITNLRGNIIPVIDLRERFNLNELNYTENTRVIIVKYDSYQIGMIVDSSSETLQLDEKDIEIKPTVNAVVDEEFIKEIGKHNNRIIMLLDLKKILDIEDEE